MLESRRSLYKIYMSLIYKLQYNFNLDSWLCTHSSSFAVIFSVSHATKGTFPKKDHLQQRSSNSSTALWKRVSIFFYYISFVHGSAQWLPRSLKWLAVDVVEKQTSDRLNCIKGKLVSVFSRHSDTAKRRLEASRYLRTKR